MNTQTLTRYRIWPDLGYFMNQALATSTQSAMAKRPDWSGLSDGRQTTTTCVFRPLGSE